MPRDQLTPEGTRWELGQIMPYATKRGRFQCIHTQNRRPADLQNGTG